MKDDFEYQNQGKSYDPIAKYKQQDVAYQNLKKINYFRDMYIEQSNLKKYKRMQRQQSIHQNDDASSTKSMGGMIEHYEDPYAKFKVDSGFNQEIEK